MTKADVHTPPVHERVFSLDGLFLLGMFCELPNAKRADKLVKYEDCRVCFHDVEFDFVEVNGERCVSAKAVAEGIGYSDYRLLLRLIKRNQSEFLGKVFVVKTTTNSPGRPEATFLTYHGVLRVAMLSDAPRAIPFRDFAETVLYSVMTTGFKVRFRSSEISRPRARLLPLPRAFGSREG